MSTLERKKILVYGIVQGVGFRPFVSRTAKKTGVRGSVCNKGPYVEIHAEGPDEKIREFLKSLREEAPERSAILKTEVHEEEPLYERSFNIIESEKVKGDIFVSPDIAICPRCAKELYDPKDRRYLHPFINCTACGPRLTILDSMPYDRVRTSMSEFPMCPDCGWEYTHPETRRYHAQPVCCNDCGPEIYIAGKNIRGRDAIIYTREMLRQGKIAAVKGIGGFHLCCDAADGAAVRRLRELKNRPFKPFAVMLKNMETVRRECRILPGQEEILRGPNKPILLLERLRGTEKKKRLCPEVAPGNPNVGVMLPYAPVQMLLFDYPDGKSMTDCFVMTSGNPKGAPICRTDEEAVEALGGLCDVILSHNRKIRLRADDSVMSWMNGAPYMIRRSRGYAPLPVILSHSGEKEYDEGAGKRKNVPETKKCVLGIGGELKNTFCLAKNELFYMSPYIGDMEDMRSVKALREAIVRMEQLLEMKPAAAACDLHPKYNTGKIAEDMGIPVIRVQHHYAHVLSCMAENDHIEPVIGAVFDGTGYGTDGTIWGGEFLLADIHGFSRAGSIDTFFQAGGDLAAKEGWRVAAAILQDVCSSREEAASLAERLGICSGEEFKVISAMVKNRINTVSSTSAGRIFDAVSAMLGFRRVSSCEGEASMVLEFAAEEYLRKNPEAGEEISGSGADGMIPDTGGADNEGKEIFRLDIKSLFRELMDRRLSGEDPDRLAYIFHRRMAELVLEGCRKCRKISGRNTVALSGGVMQNILFVSMCRELLEKDGFFVLIHQMIPPNDGGIGLGQALYAMHNSE